MSYFRLRDIKTPPFAYILNREEVVKTCPACQLPFQPLVSPLKVEICVNQPSAWLGELQGQPMMADHWLIGDETFGETLGQLLGDHMAQTQVEITAWLTTEPSFGQPLNGRHQQAKAPAYFHYFPKTHLDLAAEVTERFPPIWCQTCRRKIPNIPFDYQPAPDSIGQVPFAALNHCHFDGYDYLFHETLVAKLSQHFPNMLLEKLPTPGLV